MSTIGMRNVDGSDSTEKAHLGRMIRYSIFGSPLWIYVVFLALPCLFLLVLAVQPFVALDLLVRDPLAAADAPFYYGLVSNAGIVVWCATAAVCLFAAVVRWQSGADGNRGVWFLAYAGGLTAVLMLDDFFMLHEAVFPYYLFVPEPVVFGAYGLGMLAYVVLFHRTILSLEPLLLALCFGFFGLSVIGDVIWHQPVDVLSSLVEDGSKFIGICLWSAFHLRAAWHFVSAIGLESTTGGDQADNSGHTATH